MRKLILVGAATFVSLTPPTSAQERQSGSDVLVAYQKGFVARNADGLAALYGEDAVLLPPNEPAVKGREAIRNWYVKSFASGISGFRMRAMFTVAEGHLESEWGEYSVVLPPDSNREERRVEMKYVWSLRRSPAGWHIAAHMFNTSR